MVICHCNVINDRRIRELVVTGDVSLQDIGAKCGAGQNCGGCVAAIEELLDELGATA